MFVDLIKIKAQAVVIKNGYQQEYRETIDMLRLARKKGKSDKDRLFIRDQSVDLARISIMTGIVVLPGGALILAFVETGLRRIMFRAGSCYTCPNCFATTGVCN